MTHTLRVIRAKNCIYIPHHPLIYMDSSSTFFISTTVKTDTGAFYPFKEKPLRGRPQLGTCMSFSHLSQVMERKMYEFWMLAVTTTWSWFFSRHFKSICFLARFAQYHSMIPFCFGVQSLHLYFVSLCTSIFFRFHLYSWHYLFVFYLVFAIPLHAAYKGYGSGLPLPLRTAATIFPPLTISHPRLKWSILAGLPNLLLPMSTSQKKCAPKKSKIPVVSISNAVYLSSSCNIL